MARTKTTAYHPARPPSAKTPREPEEKPSDSEEEPEDSTEAEDRGIIPQVISFTDSPMLLSPRVEPVADPKWQWAKNPSYPVHNFPVPPTSGILFCDVGVTKDPVPKVEQRVRYPPSKKSSFFLANSLFRSRLLRQEFPWSPLIFLFLYWLKNLGVMGGSCLCQRFVVR